MKNPVIVDSVYLNWYTKGSNIVFRIYWWIKCVVNLKVPKDAVIAYSIDKKPGEQKIFVFCLSADESNASL